MANEERPVSIKRPKTFVEFMQTYAPVASSEDTRSAQEQWYDVIKTLYSGTDCGTLNSVTDCQSFETTTKLLDQQDKAIREAVKTKVDELGLTAEDCVPGEIERTRNYFVDVIATYASVDNDMLITDFGSLAESLLGGGCALDKEARETDLRIVRAKIAAEVDLSCKEKFPQQTPQGLPPEQSLPGRP